LTPTESGASAEGTRHARTGLPADDS
jgi:hypothetical protein